MSRLPLALSALVLAVSVLVPDEVRAEDPLDSVDGTEGWDNIDTSAVDEAAAWRKWRFDLRRWEAGRARLEAERARMTELRRRVRGDAGTEVPPAADQGDESHQARVDGARRSEQAGQPDRRDSEGQAMDDERPWSRR